MVAKRRKSSGPTKKSTTNHDTPNGNSISSTARDKGFSVAQAAPVILDYYSECMGIRAVAHVKSTNWHQWIPRLKARQVPLQEWALQVLVHTSGSLLNNWAFAYQVPLTLLIVFRSAGELVVSYLEEASL
ncbi:hypothetical protein H0H92_008496 [Tricholoma furcatifolium]|nr:hypothetical protein H0H92_008496 [Tricholoma furcatifolium]